MPPAKEIRSALELQAKRRPAEPAERDRVKPAGRTAIGLMLTIVEDPPTGEVQLGTRRWRFTNRVEMLQAIDAAYEEASRTPADS